MNTTQKIVFEHENSQVIQEGKKYFTRTTEDEECFESGDFNTLERAIESLHIEPKKEENDILISLFLGGNLDPETDNFWLENLKLPENQTRSHIEQCKYSSSWDWLMPVVEKIEGEELNFNVKFEHKCCVILNSDLPNFEPIWIFPAEPDKVSKIEVVYEAVVQFIKWYNQSEKP
jgi:hypothetical protein